MTISVRSFYLQQSFITNMLNLHVRIFCRFRIYPNEGLLLEGAGYNIDIVLAALHFEVLKEEVLPTQLH